MRILKLVLLLLALVPLLNFGAGFTNIKLRNLVSFDFPNEWQILNKDDVVSVDQYLHTIMPNPGTENTLGFYGFKLSENQVDIAKMNIRFYPDITIDQASVSQASPQNIAVYDRKLRADSEKSIAIFAQKLGNKSYFEWLGTKRVKWGGKYVLVSSYRRGPATEDEGFFTVKLLRVYSGDQSMTITLSYNEDFPEYKKSVAALEKSLKFLR